MGYLVRYTDDRGELMRSGYLRTVGQARRAGIPKSAAKRALRAVNYQGALLGAVFGGCIITMNTLVGGVLPTHLSSIGYVLSGVLVVALGLALHPITVPRAIRSHKQGFLREGYCPACGYAVAEFEPEADDCRVCPECGAAWRLTEDVLDQKPEPGTP